MTAPRTAGSPVLRSALRLVCVVLGHAGNRMIALPQDLFGLYVFSRIECPRCGVTLEEGMTQDDQIRHLVKVIDELRGEETPPTATLIDTALPSAPEEPVPTTGVLGVEPQRDGYVGAHDQRSSTPNSDTSCDWVCGLSARSHTAATGHSFSPAGAPPHDFHDFIESRGDTGWRRP